MSMKRTSLGSEISLNVSVVSFFFFNWQKKNQTLLISPPSRLPSLDDTITPNQLIITLRSSAVEQLLNVTF